MPRSEGIETSPILYSEMIFAEDPERMPRSEGIETYLDRASLGLASSPERMPRSEGIETIKTGFLKPANIRYPERMPRSEGIETGLRPYRDDCYRSPGTNAPIRGD